MGDMKEAQEKCKLDFLENFSRTAHSATCDFEIVCGDEKFQVHRLILSIHSKYFKKLCESSFKEGLERTVTLHDDPILAVKSMIEYFYEFKYGKALDDFDFDSRSESEPSNLYEAHAQVFSIADKYDIPGLKEIAIERFRECFDASRSWAQDSADFLIATPFIYRHAPPNDRRLCREVLHCWQSGEWSTVAFSGREEFVQLLADVPDFAADLIGMASGVEAGSQLDEMDE